MADPFIIPSAILSAISAVFGLFVSIFIFAIPLLIPRETDSEEKEHQRTFVKNVFLKKFLPIAYIVFIIELFNSLVLFFVVDKTFQDFYWFEFCSYVIFVLTFMVMFQFSIQLILYPFYLRINEDEYKKKMSTFNQVTTFLAVNFVCIAVYFFITKRVIPQNSVIPVQSVVLYVIFCVFLGLLLWFFFQKRELEIVLLLGLETICLLLLYLNGTSYLNNYLDKYWEPYWQQYYLQYIMVCAIPILLLLAIALSHSISHDVD